MSPGTKDPNKRGSRGLRGRPGIGRPGSRRGGDDRPSAPGGSARGVGMTVSKSCPPGPTRRTDRSPGRRRALLPLQSLGGSLHYRGSNGGEGGRVCTGIQAGSAGSSCRGRTLPNPGRAGVVLAAAASCQSRSFQGSGWRACLRTCLCARLCVPRHACDPIHMHALTYCPRQRREPWLPRMRSLPIYTRTAALVSHERAEWLLKGRKQGSRPVSC